MDGKKNKIFGGFSIAWIYSSDDRPKVGITV